MIDLYIYNVLTYLDFILSVNAQQSQSWNCLFIHESYLILSLLNFASLKGKGNANI